MAISLAKSLPDPAQGYTLYLDNLFNNILLAHALAQLEIGIMGTARVNAIGLSLSLVQLKHTKDSLKWGYLETAIVTYYKQASQSRTQSTVPINYDL